jgi:alcohol dehydrogenase class IV
MQARTYAHIAAWMSISGLANVQLGLSHGIGHQLGARCNVPHGHTSAVMMHSVMTWNKDYVGTKQKWIAEIMGIDTSKMSLEEAGQAGRDAVLDLVISLDQPHRLSEVQVGRDKFEAIASDAMNDLVVSTNPRPVTSRDDVMEVLEMAF